MDWIKHFQRTVILYLVFSLFQYAANETTNIPPLKSNCTDNYLEKPSNCQSFVEEKNYLVVEIFYSCYFSGGKFNQITFKKDDDILKSHALTKGKDLEKDIIGVNGETGNIEILFTVNDKIGHKCSSHMINFLNKPGSSLGEYCEVSSDCVAMLDHTYCDDTNFCDCGYNYCRSENKCVLCPGLGENCSLSLECSGSGVACNSYTTICECKEGYSAYNGFCVENSILSTDTAARVAVICSGIIALSLVIGIAWNAIKRHSFIRALLARRRDEQRTQQRERDGTSSSLDDEIEVRLRDRPPTYNYAVEDKPPTYEEFDSDLNYRVESIVIPSAPGMDDLQNNQAAADSPQNNQAAADSPQNNQAAADSPQNPERVGHTNPAFDNETDHQSEDL